MMYFLPDNVKTEALLKSGQQLIQDPDKWCKGAMQKGDSFCINGALFAVGTPTLGCPMNLYQRMFSTSGEIYPEGSYQSLSGF